MAWLKMDIGLQKRDHPSPPHTDRRTAFRNHLQSATNTALTFTGRRRRVIMAVADIVTYLRMLG